MTALHLRNRQPVQLAIGPVVAFAAFFVGAIRALFASAAHASSSPSFDEIVLRVQWPILILLALAVAAPAAILSLLESGAGPRVASRSPFLNIAVLAAALAAIGIAYLLGPRLLEIT